MQATCASLSATTISIHNQAMNDAVAGPESCVKTAFSNRSHLGLINRAGRVYGWIPLSGFGVTLAWADGTPFNFANWASKNTIDPACQQPGAVTCYVDIVAVNDGLAGALQGQWKMYSNPSTQDPFVCARKPI